MASKKTNNATVTALNEITKPEFMTGAQYAEAYDDTQGGDLIIRIPDNGNSIFRAPKENKSGNGSPLTKARFSIVDFGGFRAIEVPNELTFDNGRHAGQTVYASLSMYTLPALAQLPVEETQSALNEVLNGAEFLSDEQANKVRAAAQAMLANIEKVLASKAQAEAAKVEATNGNKAQAKQTQPATVKA